MSSGGASEDGEGPASYLLDAGAGAGLPLAVIRSTKCANPDPSRERYPSSSIGDPSSNMPHDVDSSTELWDDEEDDPPHCSQCSTSLQQTDYTEGLRTKVQQQLHSIRELRAKIRDLEGVQVGASLLEKEKGVADERVRKQQAEIERLGAMLDEHEQLNQQNEDLRLLLRLKDEEIRMLSKDVSKLSDRVADYTEIESHNTDLQSELFARDREVMALKHSEERLKGTYLELVGKNSELEEKLLEQDGKHEEQKQRFEGSIVKLTNKLIDQRKKNEELEQTNARAVRDCRLAVRLLQCSSPASNEHTNKFHQSNKLTFLFEGANNKPISSADAPNHPKHGKKDLKQLRRSSEEEEEEQTGTKMEQPSNKTTCLESFQSLQCINYSRQYNYGQKGGGKCATSKGAACVECTKNESVSVLKDLLQGKKDAIHVLRVELGKRDKEIALLRRKLTQNLSQSLNAKEMGPGERIENLESRVSFLNDENFNLKYQLEICRKMLDKLSGVPGNGQ